jgi:hypothetical protein
MHDGFYFRIQAGGGSGYAKYEDLFEFYGGAGLFSMHFGGTVAKDLILYGKLSSSTLTNPDVTILGTFAGETEDTTYDVSAIGAGISYYLPYNFYISGSLDIPVATLTIGKEEGSSEAGLGFDLAVGKEWWISDNWGLGLAINTQFSRLTDKDDSGKEYDLGNVFFGLLFSATYN